jgi:hypothetical protein
MSKSKGPSWSEDDRPYERPVGQANRRPVMRPCPQPPLLSRRTRDRLPGSCRRMDPRDRGHSRHSGSVRSRRPASRSGGIRESRTARQSWHGQLTEAATANGQLTNAPARADTRRHAGTSDRRMSSMKAQRTVPADTGRYRPCRIPASAPAFAHASHAEE